MILRPEEAATVRRHAIEAYPEESCGVILERNGERRVVRCRNVQNDLHAKDPARHPRDARTAYYVDPQDLLKIGRLESEGFSVAIIYHSHVDAGAYFSETDRRQALAGSQPLYPDATYVVTSIVDRAVAAIAAFRWDAARADFVQVALPDVARTGAGGAGTPSA